MQGKTIEAQNGSGEKGASPQVYNILTDKAVFDEALVSQIGKKPSEGYQDEDRAFANGFYRIANQEMVDWLSENPNHKKVPDNVRSEIVDKLTEKMYTSPKSFFGLFNYGEVENSVVEEIISDLDDAGIPPTSYNIFKTYQNAKKSGAIQ